MLWTGFSSLYWHPLHLHLLEFWRSMFMAINQSLKDPRTLLRWKRKMLHRLQRQSTSQLAFRRHSPAPSTHSFTVHIQGTGNGHVIELEMQEQEKVEDSCEVHASESNGKESSKNIEIDDAREKSMDLDDNDEKSLLSRELTFSNLGE